MASTATYLNFASQTEEAFNFYKSVFGGEFEGGTMHRFGEIPPSPDMPELDEATKKMVMHVTLPILGGHRLMGTDAPVTMGFNLKEGNNFYISLHPDSREQTEELFNTLATGGIIEQPLADMFWGSYYGRCRDKFGIGWMLNFES